jgi:hypothetical protein
MAAPNQQANNQNPDESTNPSNQPSEATNSQLENTENQSSDTDTPNNHQPFFKDRWHYIRHKDNQPHVANIVAIFALFIGGYLALYTYRVFNQTSLQTIATLRADSIAQDALNTTKRYNDSIRKAQVIADKKADDTDRLKSHRADSIFNLQKNSVDAQIASLKETQRQFKIENEVFIQVGNFESKSLLPYPAFYFWIFDLSKQAVKIDSGFYKVFIFRKFAPFDKSVFTDKAIFEKHLKNLYVVNQSPQSCFWEGTESSPEALNNVKNDICSFYIYGKINYRNVADIERRQYTFAVEFNASKGTAYNVLYSENKSIK